MYVIIVGFVLTVIGLVFTIPRSRHFLLNKFPFLKEQASYVGNIFNRIKITEPKPARTLNKLSKVLKWGLTKEEIDYTKNDYNKFLSGLSKLSRVSREFLCAIIERSSQDERNRRKVLACDIENYLLLQAAEIKRQVSVLGNYGFTHIDKDWDDNFYIYAYSPGIDFDIYEEITKFCKEEQISLKRILINLEFNLFD